MRIDLETTSPSQDTMIDDTIQTDAVYSQNLELSVRPMLVS